MTRATRFLTLIATVLLVTACSGGGGGGGSNASTAGSGSSGTGSPTPTTPPPSSGGGSTPTTPSTPTVAHTLQLSWTIPTTRQDGTALSLSELAGYQVYYYQDGSSAGAGEVVDISGGSTTSTQVTINGSGVYYLAIAARDQSGLLSNLSNYVSVTLN